MNKPFLARYMCLVTHDRYIAGQMYTVEEYGSIEDFYLDLRSWKINGERIDETKFKRVHHHISQNGY